MRLPLPPCRFDGMHNERLGNTPLDGFDDIILPHLDAAYNLARWLVRNGTDADDVTQEACLRAYRYFGTFRGGNARAWLLRIVRTTAIRWLQKNRGQQLAAEFNEDIHSSGAETLDPEASLLQGADTRLLERAMDQLPDRLREVLMLRELEGLSYREIAEVVGIPIGTVMSTLHRARERFRHEARVLLGPQAQPTGSASSEADVENLDQEVVSV